MGDVPDALCAATGCPGLIYERPGYGASGPRPLPWPADVLEQEATIVLPALLDALSIDRPVLIRHSDGGTIALLYAAAFPERVGAVVTLAAHVVLDELTRAGVAALERSWREGNLRSELEHLHGPGADALFRAWSQLWLDPARRDWSIVDRLPHITCPVLAIQGADDEYGLPAQLDAIVTAVAGPAERVLIPDCGHDPHHQARAVVVERMAAFVRARQRVTAPSHHSMRLTHEKRWRLTRDAREARKAAPRGPPSISSRHGRSTGGWISLKVDRSKQDPPRRLTCDTGFDLARRSSRLPAARWHQRRPVLPKS